MLLGHYIERRSLATISVSRDIAHHLFTRQLPGRVVIVTSRPDVFMASVSKQWASVTRQVERQMASTLNIVRREELIQAIHHMHTLRFSVKPLPADLITGVVFMTEPQCRQAPPTCHTLYVTEDADNAAVEAISKDMTAHGLIVLYDKE